LIRKVFGILALTKILEVEVPGASPFV